MIFYSIKLMTATIEIGCQHWPAMQYCVKKEVSFWNNLDEILGAYASEGPLLWEGSVDTDLESSQLGAALQHHRMKACSVYHGGCWHNSDWRENVPAFMAAVQRAQALGCHTVCCNPEPLSWSESWEKTDEQLRNQSAALQHLAELLYEQGMILSYHWHFPEFRSGGREMLHILLNTDPKLLKVCFDVHWTYCGFGRSEQVMFDLLEWQLPRVSSFHVRQSCEGIWSRVFGSGDIDYKRWHRILLKRDWRGPVYLEQCLSDNTPIPKDFYEDQRASLRSLRQLLAG